MPAPVNEQDQGCPPLSELNVEPCCSRHGVDKYLEMQWCDQNRRLPILFACAPAGHSDELLPASAQEPERMAPSSSRSSGGASGRNRHRDRGDRSRESSEGPISSRTRRRLARVNAEPSRSALNNDESHATPASTSLSPGRFEARQDRDHPRRPARRVRSATSHHPYSLVFRKDRPNRIPARPQSDPTSVVTPSPVARRAGDNRFESRSAVDAFLRENGIEPSPRLKPQDAALADATLDVKSARITALFGGLPIQERPRSRVRNILCFDPVVQPYAPSSPGVSGVLFNTPGALLFEDEHPSCHIFINTSPHKTRTINKRYSYVGEYVKVPIKNTSVEPEEWRSLPSTCRAAWIWRIQSSQAHYIRAIHARISINNARPRGPPPSQGEIEEWLENRPGRYEGTAKSALNNAFDQGEEKMKFTLVKYLGYHVGIAMELQGMGSSD